MANKRWQEYDELGEAPAGTDTLLVRDVSDTTDDADGTVKQVDVSDLFSGLEFIDLGDVPASYAGQGGKVVAVNVGATALEFVTVAGGGDMLAAQWTGGGSAVNLQNVDNHVDGSTNKVFTAVDEAALAVAVLETDTSTASMQFVIDEDSMASNLATKVPTQQSVKAYVDAEVGAGVPDGDKGDITVSETGTVWAINDDVISSAQLNTNILGGGDQVEVTIASGSITPTNVFTIVDTEADAAADDLTNILKTNFPAGTVLIIRCADNSRVVTVKHDVGGAGEIQLADATDFVLDDTTKYLALRSTAGADWEEIWRSWGNDVAGLRTWLLGSTNITAGTGLTGGGPMDGGVSLAADIASEAEAKAGTSATKLMTPQRGRQLYSTYVPTNGTAAGANITVILTSHAGQTIKFDQALTLDNAFAAGLWVVLNNVHASSNLAITMEPGAAVAVADGAWGSSSGTATTITSATNALPLFVAGEFFAVTNHSTAANNGTYVATGTPTTASLAATKVTGSNPANAAAEAVDIAAVGTINGATSYTIPAGGEILLRCVANPGDEPQCEVRGDATTVYFGGREVSGGAVGVETVSGVLNSTHIGKRLTTSAAITVPTTPTGWWAIVRLGGDHDIDFNSNTLDVSGQTWGTGDKLAITVTSATTIEIERTAAADIVDQTDFA